MICETNSSILPATNEGALSGGTCCVVDFSKELMDFVRKESCGKCVLCREGSWQVYKIIADITEGRGGSEDYELLKELLEMISQNAGCEMSATAASRCLGLLNSYQEEWDLHIRRKRCTNLICKQAFTLYIAPDTCDGCGKCQEVCPEGAISGGKGMIHVIHPEICTKCMQCIGCCPKEAIKKAGAVKPKVPAEPIPVGSFGGSAGSNEAGTSMRRRRRGE
jgi:NADH-quinone oxidoreductase subunit F